MESAPQLLVPVLPSLPGVSLEIEAAVAYNFGNHIRVEAVARDGHAPPTVSRLWLIGVGFRLIEEYRADGCRCAFVVTDADDVLATELKWAIFLYETR